MLSISTSWKSLKAETAQDILRPLLKLRVKAVELEYRITEEIFRQMLPDLKRNEPAVSSVHNFFPVPPILTKHEASGDAFSLSSPDKEERERAVKYTLRTLEFAREAGASAVVLHLGLTEMDDEYSRLKEEHKRGDAPHRRNQIEALANERRRISRKYLDAALFSLDKLWLPAEKLSLTLGIENRNTLREVPDADETEAIFRKFEGAPIGYWHDTGHGAIQELFYGVNHETQLSRFADRLVGVHLHDAEAGNDHMAPGKGKIDFDMIKKYVGVAAIRVIETHSGVTEEELREGIDFLREHGLVFDNDLL
jgi:sugar phosphate isomerase/epimerase